MSKTFSGFRVRTFGKSRWSSRSILGNLLKIVASGLTPTSDSSAVELNLTADELYVLIVLAVQPESTIADLANAVLLPSRDIGCAIFRLECKGILSGSKQAVGDVRHLRISERGHLILSEYRVRAVLANRLEMTPYYGPMM